MAADSIIEDALTVTRNLHRLIITVSLITMVFSLSLQFPDKTRLYLSTVDEFLRFEFQSYDRFIALEANSASLHSLKPVADQMRTNLNSTNYLVFGANEIFAAVERPILLGQFRVNETKLTAPSEVTIKQLDILAEAYPLYSDVLMPIPEPASLLHQLHEFFADRAKPGMRVQTVNLQTSETYLNTEPPSDGEPIKMLLSFELMPSGGPPSPYFQGTFDAKVVRLPGTSFRQWIQGRPNLKNLVRVETNTLKWLPALAELPRELSERRLGEVFSILSDELKKGSPESKSVSLLGAEVPGLLLIYAAPLTLLALSYYFLFHLTHLGRFAPENKALYVRFAWLPLSIDRQWVLEAMATMIVLPILAIAILAVQLLRFKFLTLTPGIFILGATILLGWLGWRSVHRLAGLRGHLGKPAKLGFYKNLKG